MRLKQPSFVSYNTRFVFRRHGRALFLSFKNFFFRLVTSYYVTYLLSFQALRKKHIVLIIKTGNNNMKYSTLSVNYVFFFFQINLRCIYSQLTLIFDRTLNAFFHIKKMEVESMKIIKQNSMNCIFYKLDISFSESVCLSIPSLRSLGAMLTKLGCN